jgi:hypothetical protein
MKIEQTECSEMLAFNLQMPANNPEESIQRSEHGKFRNQDLPETFIHN